MPFYYPNYQNDMWRIFGICFYGDKNHFLIEREKRFSQDLIVPFLREKRIAMSDTAAEVVRTKNTASDKDLEIVEQTDLDALLRALPLCEAVITAGQLATSVFCRHFQISEPRVGGFSELTFEGREVRLYRMPSSSRAYPMTVERKAQAYRKVFGWLGMVGHER